MENGRLLCVVLALFYAMIGVELPTSTAQCAGPSLEYAVPPGSNYQLCYSVEDPLNSSDGIEVTYSIDLRKYITQVHADSLPYYRLTWLLGNGDFIRERVPSQQSLSGGQEYFPHSFTYNYKNDITHTPVVYIAAVYSDSDAPPKIIANDNQGGNQNSVTNLNVLSQLPAFPLTRIDKGRTIVDLEGISTTIPPDSSPFVSIILHEVPRPNYPTLVLLRYQAGYRTLYTSSSQSGGNNNDILESLHFGLNSDLTLQHFDIEQVYAYHNEQESLLAAFPTDVQNEIDNDFATPINLDMSLSTKLNPSEYRYVFIELSGLEEMNEHIGDLTEIGAILKYQRASSSFAYRTDLAIDAFDNAYDPNDLQFLQDCFEEEDTIRLRVRFENTGSREVNNVSVRVNINQNLGAGTTVQLLNHFPQMGQLFGGNPGFTANETIIQYNFTGIFLPGVEQLARDSNVLGSPHGFLDLLIIPKDSIRADTLKAFATIEFKTSVTQSLDTDVASMPLCNVIMTEVDFLSENSFFFDGIYAGLNFPQASRGLEMGDAWQNVHLGFSRALADEPIPIKKLYVQLEAALSYSEWKDQRPVVTETYQLLHGKISAAYRYNFAHWVGMGVGPQLSFQIGANQFGSSDVDRSFSNVLAGGYWDLIFGQLERGYSYGVRLNADYAEQFADRDDYWLLTWQLYAKFNFGLKGHFN